jgi:hypothetical protein
LHIKGLHCMLGFGAFRLELREELRLENRLAFANIWSDFTAGLTILLLLVLNKRQVQILVPCFQCFDRILSPCTIKLGLHQLGFHFGSHLDLLWEGS